MLAQLGNHKFEGFKAPKTISESHSVKYGQVSLINEKDTIQFTGEELKKFSLEMRYSIDFCDPAEEIASLRKSMMDAEAMPFLLGDGTVIGKFVITDMKIDGEFYSASGSLESAKVKVSLLEKAAEEAEVVSGAAFESADPLEQVPEVNDASPATSVVEDINDAKISQAVIAEEIADVENEKKGLKTCLRNIQEKAQEMLDAFDSALDKIKDSGKLTERGEALIDALQDATGSAKTIIDIDNIKNIDDLKEKGRDLADKMKEVLSKSAAVVTLSATREKDDDTDAASQG